MHLPRGGWSASGALCVLGAIVIALGGCGSDEVEGQSCDPGERLNPVSGRCVEDVRSGPGADAGEDADAGGDDAGNLPDAGEDADAGGDEDTCALDMDLQSEAVCQFYAHSASMLYLIDPFRLTIEEVRSVPEGLFDIDTHPDGRLFGITPEGLYRFDASAESWELMEPLSGLANPNGLCIDTGGQGYLTSYDELYTVDLESGAVALVGETGGGFSSSGDCVIDKGNTILMSSAPRGFSQDDELVWLNGDTGEGSLRGRTGHADIYGLTAAWGILFGTTGEGKLLRINPATGVADELHDFGDIVFNGAASSPAR
ncbi:hypothetical protein FRC98_19590 [Lujinxingia vulgaris]|uniref:SMP-30/Gluconolactonase/LRE-like region domain-containing protein n=1 Tax=Lujinxingia vulgaris TaxID=2600176 RepID=A0A5C6X1F0_9DELT|nr:hypothetical protein [Lujinxingia vulgaris]TXD34063.1 hypothetical protein FRC98_19590 [Lujinxingia vulgaris]